jgi:hypothetical protein
MKISLNLNNTDFPNPMWLLTSRPRQSVITLTFIDSKLYISQCEMSGGYSLTKTVKEVRHLRHFIKVSNKTKDLLNI